MTTSESPDSPGAKASADVTRTAGRGGLAVAFAKIYFILVGLVQQVILPRVLGLDGYGALSSVMSISSIAYNPIVSTSIQGVSRAVAQSPDAEQAQAVRRTLAIHAALAVPLGLGFFLLAGPIGRMAGAPHLVGALRIISGVVLFYSLYTPLVGVLNGQKRFVWQAGLDMLYATIRTVALVGGAVALAGPLGSKVSGSAAGFVGASAAIFVIALALVGIGKRGAGGPSIGRHLQFIAPLLLGQTLLNLLLQADLTLLRAFAADSATLAGLGPEAADPLVGAYRATQLFCFLPYQLLLAVTFILFPMLATAHRDGDREAVKRYVRSGVRLALVLAGLMVSVTSGLSAPLMRLVFPPEAADLGARSMQLLSLGFGAFAVFGILTTALTSLKREVASMAITAVAFALVVAMCFLRVRGTPFGAELLWRTATATTSGLVLATFGAAVLLHRTAGSVAPLASVLRVVGAMSVTIVVGRFLPHPGKLMTLAYSAALAAIYVALLLISRELGKADLATVKAVIGRKAQPGPTK
ncbi:MAG: lipopolysaccharide biosynthesis protein [Polyangiaceae bacterium]|nr:lipopolysaccharide biosynthesis protein [Polyangiaceae bacterium]